MILTFCFDGTWNGRDDPVPTNVLKIHRYLRRGSETSFYFEGPGNATNWVTKMFGAAFGVGCWGIRDAALDVLGSVYRPGDRIAVVGFSRGAAVARMFCARIGERGVNGHFPGVAFLGCFDTVGAFLPVGRAQQGTLFHDLHVSPCVKIARHAVSIDEDRKSFTPNLMNKRDGVEEVWFAGGHSDVGGGLENEGLSDIAMSWMLGHLTRLGLHFIPDIHQPDALSDIYRAPGFYRRGPREVGVKVDDAFSDWLKPVVHATVRVRQSSYPQYQPNL